MVISNQSSNEPKRPFRSLCAYLFLKRYYQVQSLEEEMRQQLIHKRIVPHKTASPKTSFSSLPLCVHV